jgi:hypothetical protein
MSKPANQFGRKWLPRFSLLTVLLLMTIVGLSIGLVQLWQEVGPLREANRQMRTELGLLNIEDSKKAYAISLPTFEDDSWKWRIYLPAGGNYTLNSYSGRLPSASQQHDKEWYRAMRKDGVGSSSTISGFEGEFMLEAKAVQQGKDWMLVTKSIKREGNSSVSGGGKTSISQPSGDWLSDRRSRITSSDASVTQKSFEPDAPILLLLGQLPVITETPGGGFNAQSPTGASDGFALWLEPRRPAVVTRNTPNNGQ